MLFTLNNLTFLTTFLLVLNHPVLDVYHLFGIASMRPILSMILIILLVLLSILIHLGLFLSLSLSLLYLLIIILSLLVLLHRSFSLDYHHLILAVICPNVFSWLNNFLFLLLVDCLVLD